MERPFKDKRPFRSKRPIGQILFKQIGSNNYNYNTTECDKELCFDGMTKVEALRDILEVYQHVSNVAPERYSNVGVDIDRVTIVGSVATGNFGCRDIEKMDELVREEYELLFEREQAKLASNLISQANSIMELDKLITEELENNPTTREADILLSMQADLCSDVDMFMPADVSIDAFSELQEQPDFREVQNNLGVETNEMTDLNMVFEPGVRPREMFEAQSGEPIISSPNELQEIIEEAP